MNIVLETHGNSSSSTVLMGDVRITSSSSANSIYQRFKETPPMAYCWEAYAKLRVSMANWYILVIKMKPTQFWF